MKYLAIAVLAAFSSASCVVNEPPAREFDPGVVGHAGSGVVFPEMLGEFKRGDVTDFKNDGTNLGVTYTRSHLVDRLNASVFVYPGPELRSMGSSNATKNEARKLLLDGHFDGVKQEVFAANAGAKLVDEAEFTMFLFGEHRPAKSAVFSYSDGTSFFSVDYVSNATVVALDQWVVKLRMTMPEDSAMRSREQVNGFFTAFIDANAAALTESN